MNDRDFLARIDRSAGPRGCWPWSGPLDPAGYGLAVRVSGKEARPHVCAYALFVGAMPPGRVLHHWCMNRACCNPKHLVPMGRGQHMKMHGAADAFLFDRDGVCRKGHPFGGTGRCPTCNREAQARWRARNPETHKERTEAWRKAHLPEVRDRQRRWAARRRADAHNA